MLKKILKKTGTVLFIIVLLFGVARFLDKSLGGIYDAARAPYLQMPTQNSIIIRWQTKKQNRGVVRIGKSINQVDKVFSENSADDEHSLQLTGLEPNTKYYYRIGTRRYSIYQGEQYWFKTLPDNKQQLIRFWVTGDQGQAGDTQSNVTSAMLSWIKQNPARGRTDEDAKIDFWLTTGDNAYRSGTNQQFQDNFFTPYADILKHTPVWPIYGNHDARRWVFYNIFSFPAQAQAGGVASSTEKYYSFNYANLHVVVLDTQSSRIQKNSKMLRWLQQDVAAIKQKWFVTIFHHPPYSKGTHDSDNPADSFNRMQNIRRYILPVLEQAGVDVVLSGHSHMYERSWFMSCHYGRSSTFRKRFIQDRKPQGDITAIDIRQAQKGLTYRKLQAGLPAHAGTVYITLGSSSKLDQGDLNHIANPVSLHKAGSMVFDIVDNKLTANFIDQAGQIADTFSIVKDVAKASAVAVRCQ